MQLSLLKNNYLLPIIVFFSGFCSLVYQTAWERVIKSYLGGDQISSFVVTSCFILGIGLGAFLFRKSFKKPLKVYAIIEFFIAIFAIFSYYIFVDSIVVFNNLFLNIFDIKYIRVSSILFTFLLLILPCILIGGTLPIFFDCFIDKKKFAASRIGFIYGINTLGACIGIASIPIIFFNQLNIPSTLLIVGLLNLFISFSLFLLHLKSKSQKYSKNIQKKFNVEIQKKQDMYINLKTNGFSKNNLLFLTFISGGIALAMEIIFFRLASTNWPSSAYNFPMVLSTFLFFMSLGSIFFTALINKGVQREYELIFYLFLGSIFSVIGSIIVQVYIPNSSIMLIQVKYIAMIGPFAFFQGGIFPMIIKIFSSNVDELTISTGKLYLVNSVGAFTIVILTQFFIFKLIGLKGALIAILFLCFVALLLINRTIQSIKNNTYILISSMCILIFLTQTDGQFWNKYRFYDSSEILSFSEGATGYATISWENSAENNLEKGEIKINSHFMSALPNHPRHVELEVFSLSSDLQNDILLLGLGGGGLLKELNNSSNVKNITIIEWSLEIIEELKKNRPNKFLNGVLESEKSKIIQADARQFVNLSGKKSFNIIIDNLAYSYMTGATSVKSKTYFKKVSNLLTDGGIFILSINGRDEIHAEAVLSGVIEAFKSAYFLNNTLVASNNDLGCFFDKNIQYSQECPINPALFTKVFNEHEAELANYLGKIKSKKYISSFKKLEREKFKGIEPINDDLPIYEYYLCSSIKNSKCI